jgi:MoxR-like ATPase
MQMERTLELAGRLRSELRRVIFGQDDLIDMLCTAVLSRGHILIEAVPGMGKTRAARALGKLIDGEFRRIQFTPDLMPGDIVGTTVYSFQSQHFEVVKGPVFAHVILADEVNRAPAKTQSALLQAMEERRVNIAGKDLDLSERFVVIATQNPLEMEGTYPLPEAQLDRFMLKIEMGYPGLEEEKNIYLNQMTPSKDQEALLKPVIREEDMKQIWEDMEGMLVDEKILEYVSEIILKTRNFPGIAFGASPRAGIHLLTAARAWAITQERDYVIPDDIKDLAIPVLAHRLVLDPESELEGVAPSDYLRKILNEVVVFS